MADAPTQLEALRAKRGYLLPHHGLLALLKPQLLASYDATYAALTLTPGVLSLREKETVWLAILALTEEAIATHHLRNLWDAGGDVTDLEAAVRLASFGRSARTFRFVETHWRDHAPDFDRAQAYRAALARLTEDTPLSAGLVELAMAAVHTTLAQDWELALHIRGAYAQAVSEEALAEAIALTMFPAGVPNFVDACGVWRDLVARNEVPASDPLKAWADAAVAESGYTAPTGDD